MNGESIQPVRVQRELIAHRIVQACMLLALLWKSSYYGACDKVYRTMPLADEFFPDWLESIWTLRIAMIGSIVAITWNMVSRKHWIRRLCSLITLAGVSVLCLHQGSYNDMTFATAWWTSLWALWFVHHLNDQDAGTLSRAAFLSRLIISMILLGGAVGKWTAEYWSGEVFYEIYFSQRDFWVFNSLRDRFDESTLREISMWYSRKVTVVETVFGFGLWLLPPRWAAGFAVVLLTSIALFSNFLLFSVLMSLIGLAAVGFFVSSSGP